MQEGDVLLPYGLGTLLRCSQDTETAIITHIMCIGSVQTER